MPLLTEEESALDPYRILSLEIGATEQEIKKAYRKASLKWHPDKSSAPEAPVRFREISLSIEILSDPAKRTYVDTRLETDRKRKEKYAQSDKKRKDMIDALELREEEAKKAKLDQARRRREEAAEEEIMDAGKRMLEEAQRRAAATAKTAGQAAPNLPTPVNASTSTSTSTSQPPITPLDLTLILQFPSTSNLSDSLQDRLTSSYGPINHVFIKDPPLPEGGGKKKKKGKKAIVEFKEGNWGGCWACWRDLEGGKEGWEGVKVKWAGGATPDWVAWSETHRPPRSQPTAPTSESGRDTNTRMNTNTDRNTDAPLPTFSSAPNFGSTTMSDLLASHSQSRTDQVNKKKREDEFESMTLLKMRQMERERLIEEIRREEEA